METAAGFSHSNGTNSQQLTGGSSLSLNEPPKNSVPFSIFQRNIGNIFDLDLLHMYRGLFLTTKHSVRKPEAVDSVDSVDINICCYLFCKTTRDLMESCKLHAPCAFL